MVRSPTDSGRIGRITTNSFLMGKAGPLEKSLRDLRKHVEASDRASKMKGLELSRKWKWLTLGRHRRHEIPK